MVQNNISQVGEGSENLEIELGGLSEMPNRAKSLEHLEISNIEKV